MKLRTMWVQGIIALLLLAGGSHRQASAAPLVPEQQTASDGAGSGVTPSPSVLQVTGTSNSFTISAQHADVLSLLKLVFDQSHRQFVPDGSVNGDVTLSLSGQKFETILASICKQTFLRYDIDRNNVYQFRRDDEALRSLLIKTQLINSVLQDQLRRMGYTIPAGVNRSGYAGASGLNEAAGESAHRAASPAAKGSIGWTSAKIGNGGGFGGGGGAASGGRGNETKDAAGTTQNGNTSTPNSRSKVDDKDTQADNGGVKGASVHKTDTGAKAGTQRDNLPPGPAGSTGPRGEGGPQRAGGLSGGAGAPGGADKTALMDNTLQSQVPNLENDAQYQLFLKQNNFAMINTQGEYTPVRDILADLSRQSRIPILIDPAVPKGGEFVLNGRITARPLNEVLNILAYKAHLEWRLVNGRIYVTTTPQLQFYLRGAALPGPGVPVGGGITILPPNSNARRVPPAQNKPDEADKEKPQDTKKEEKKEDKGN